MAKQPTSEPRRTRAGRLNPELQSQPAAPIVAAVARGIPDAPAPATTGRLLVQFRSDADFKDIARRVRNTTGLKTVSLREFDTAEADEVDSSDAAIVAERFGVVTVNTNKTGGMADLTASLSADETVRRVRPEFYLYSIDELRARYTDWIRQGLQILAEGAPDFAAETGLLEAAGPALGEQTFTDDDAWTWGLKATGVDRTQYTGAGIRVAILDTGIDRRHPDFQRPMKAKSFVAGETVQDGRGHGTHVAGTIAGPAQPAEGRRYGVAPNAELYIGKVLNNAGSGRESDIIRAINWAIDQKCAIVSMSLGRAAQINEPFDPIYEDIGQAALAEGCLLVAAAGNESARDYGYIAPVGSPANAPTFMSVAAVDPTLRVAPFSCGGINGGGGEINIAGPGVAVHSSFPMPRRLRSLQGTSMACPHVSGIAALWAESDASLRGARLWDALVRSARGLGSGATGKRDYGAGLVQAP